MLPQPPSLGEKLAYIDQNKWAVYVWGLLSYVALLMGMIFFLNLHPPMTWLWAPFTLLTGLYLGVSYVIGIFGKPWSQRAHQVKRNYWLTNGRPRPSIDVYLPTCGEPLEVLANTYTYVKKLLWMGELNVYVLDDAYRLHVASLADKFNFTYISRPEPRLLKKAGNLRHAFTRTNGDFILILDADFAPREDMLLEMVHYFDDEKCAIVQSPQYFTIEEDQPWIMKGAAYIQELFYRMIQVHRDTWQASICVGSCAIYRRKALEPYGGTYPIEYSEDMWTGWNLTVNGWYVKYIPLNLAKGLCPETMAAFFVQQTRWCTGAVTLCFSKVFWLSPLTPMARVCYLSGQLYYLATAVGLFLGPIPSILVVWIWPYQVYWYNCLWSIPSFLMGVVILNLWSRAPWGAYVMSTRQVSYYAHAFAIWNKLRGTMLEWIPSGDKVATRRASDYGSFKVYLFIWTSLTTFGAIGGAFLAMAGPFDFEFYPVIFFSLVNYLVCMRCLVSEA